MLYSKATKRSIISFILMLKSNNQLQHAVKNKSLGITKKNMGLIGQTDVWLKNIFVS